MASPSNGDNAPNVNILAVLTLAQFDVSCRGNALFVMVDLLAAITNGVSGRGIYAGWRISSGLPLSAEVASIGGMTQRLLAALGRALLCVACVVDAAQAAPGGDAELGRPFFEVFSPEDYHGHQQVFDIAQSSAGLIYFPGSNAVSEYDGARWRQIQVPTDSVQRVEADDAGRIWVGGLDEIGWCEADATGTTVYHSLVGRLPKECLPLGRVLSVACHEGAVWFSTNKRLLRWQEDKFDYWNFPQSSYLRVVGVGGQLWKAQRDDGLYRWDGSSWRLVSQAPEVTKDLVTLIVNDWREGVTLIGTRDGGLWTLEKDGMAKAFASDLPKCRISGGMRLKSGLLAIVTLDQGVFLLDPAGRILQNLTDQDGLPSSVVLGMAYDREGGVWIGTDIGGARLEFDPTYTCFKPDNGRGPFQAFIPFAQVDRFTRHSVTRFGDSRPDPRAARGSNRTPASKRRFTRRAITKAAAFSWARIGG